MDTVNVCLSQYSDGYSDTIAMHGDFCELDMVQIV